MPTNILLVEREKAMSANRRQSNTSSAALPIEKDQAFKANLSAREAQLQKLANAERERRNNAAAAQKLAPPKLKKYPEQRPPSASSARGETGDQFVPSSNFRGAKPGFTFKKGPSGTGYYRDDAAPPGNRGKEHVQSPQTSPSQALPPQPPPPPRGVCTVVKIHPDGTVDLQLSSGEIVEHVEQSWLEKLGRAPPEGVRPPTASSSRPSTAASERPPTATEQRLPSRASSRPPTASLSLSQANTAATTSAPTAAHKPPGTAESLHTRDLAAVINLDETLAGMGRRGGRGNIGAQRAALSDMSSLLSWQ